MTQVYNAQQGALYRERHAARTLEMFKITQVSAQGATSLDCVPRLLAENEAECGARFLEFLQPCYQLWIDWLGIVAISLAKPLLRSHRL